MAQSYVKSANEIVSRCCQYDQNSISKEQCDLCLHICLCIYIVNSEKNSSDVSR